jgi:hypothetical protein
MKTLTNLWTSLLVLPATLMALPARAASIDPSVELAGGVEPGALINNIITAVLGIAGGIAVIYLIWAGITYITGGEKGAEKGKVMLTNSLIGIAIVILAYAIFTAVTGLITQVGGR